jgi:outer membrane protein assembly factor BamB
MKLRLFCSLLAGGLLLAACEKEEVVDCPTPPTGTTTTLVNPTVYNSFVRRHEAPLQSFTVDPAAGTATVLTTSKGARITVPYGSFVMPDGTTPVTGPVQLTVREITTKPEMLLSAMPTTASGEMLVSGGQYYLRAIQNNRRLRLKSTARLNIRTPVMPTRPDNGMRLFFGVPSASGVNWVPQPASNPSTISADTIGSTGFYNIFLNNDSLGWVNVDRYLNLNPKTTVGLTIAAADVEPGNTLVYWVFDNFNTVARGTVVAGQNTVATPNVPVGQRVTAVVIRLVNGQYYFGKQTAPVAANQQYTPTLRPLSEADLLAEIRQL